VACTQFAIQTISPSNTTIVSAIPQSDPVPYCEDGYCESFNGKLRDEFLNGEIFYSLKEAQILTERWREEYNTERPHSALGYRPPAPQAILPKQPGHGDMENAPRFPHPHTPGDDYGQMSNEALH